MDIKALNFSNSKLNNIYYGGSEKKIGVIYQNENYMIKFQKNTPFGKRYNHISEYIGSHIFNMLGIDCQNTILGRYKGEEVVACKDFLKNGQQFIPFNDVGESTLETNKEIYQYSYEDIISLLEKNAKLTKIKETIENFFDIFIVDALVGNFDRHGANWGFIKENNSYKLAPVFDNGSCLFPQLTDENEMKDIIQSKEETNERVYHFPTSQIKLKGKKSSYYEVISSLEFDECNNALIRIYKKIDLNKINELINNTPFISEIHKKFYIHIINERFNKIIKYSYEKLVNKNEAN